MANISPELFPMNAGDGPKSYTQNSSYQRGGLNSTKELIDEAIANKFDTCSTDPLITIADFGCSTGPNTFAVADNIIKAIELKYKTSEQVPEFQVYFNDHFGNDFNTLFKSIPIQPKTHYFSAGVAGSFYGRLFPKASLNFVHSSYALQWLSMVPNELQDKSSPAWNKGRVSYVNSPQEVWDAYSGQYAKDMGSFLDARAEEVVPGGLMALLLIASPDDIPPSKRAFLGILDLMGATIMDMANLGIVSEAAVDSFNLPVYETTHTEFKSLVEKNGCFSIEDIQPFYRGGFDAETCAKHLRAGGFELVFKEHFHFGTEILDDFFQRFATKIADSQVFSYHIPNEVSVILKRKPY